MIKNIIIILHLCLLLGGPLQARPIILYGSYVNDQAPNYKKYMLDDTDPPDTPKNIVEHNPSATSNKIVEYDGYVDDASTINMEVERLQRFMEEQPLRRLSPEETLTTQSQEYIDLVAHAGEFAEAFRIKDKSKYNEALKKHPGPHKYHRGTKKTRLFGGKKDYGEPKPSKTFGQKIVGGIKWLFKWLMIGLFSITVGLYLLYRLLKQGWYLLTKHSDKIPLKKILQQYQPPGEEDEEEED